MIAKTMRILLAAALGVALQAAAQTSNPHAGLAPHPLPYQSKDKNLGTVTCASSLCHGSIIEWKGSSVLQNEYVTWSRVDKHANKAYQVLFNERSKRIVQNLGLKKPAYEEKICLDCHAPASPNGPHAATLEEHTHHAKGSTGSDCVACHMPKIEQTIANVNVRSHTFRFITPAMSDQLEMPNACTGCHTDRTNEWAAEALSGWSGISPWRSAQ